MLKEESWSKHQENSLTYETNSKWCFTFQQGTILRGLNVHDSADHLEERFLFSAIPIECKWEAAFFEQPISIRIPDFYLDHSSYRNKYTRYEQESNKDNKTMSKFGWGLGWLFPYCLLWKKGEKLDRNSISFTFSPGNRSRYGQSIYERIFRHSATWTVGQHILA